MKEKTILLVEDNEDDAALTRRAMQKVNPEIHMDVVTDGDYALAYLEGGGDFAKPPRPLPSLILLDVKMPGLSAFDVLKWVRESPRIPHLPILVLSSSAEPMDLRLAFDLGASAYLIKPSDFSDFIPMLRSTCEFWLKWNRVPPV